MSQADHKLGQWKCSAEEQGVPLDRYLRIHLGQVTWNYVRRLIASGRVTVDGTVVTIPTSPVLSGNVVVINPTRHAATSHERTKVRVLHVDSQIIVVDKPAGISSVPYDDKEHDTLLHRVRTFLHRTSRSHLAPVLTVHRIDKDTSGVVVFARTRAALRALKFAFRIHAIERLYLALVYGHPRDMTLCSRLIRDRGDGRRGSTSSSVLGKEATTHVRVLEQFESAALVECRLDTGRTHQIRIHLSEAGYPLVGERIYGHRPAISAIVAPRLMLHAKFLAFQHPTEGDLCQWTSEVPDDMNDVLRSLRSNNN